MRRLARPSEHGAERRRATQAKFGSSISPQEAADDMRKNLGLLCLAYFRYRRIEEAAEECSTRINRDVVQ